MKTKRVKRLKNPVSPGGLAPDPFPDLRRVRDVPGVGAALKRARSPYTKNALTEGEALNLVCDAREDEPTYPIEKLLSWV